MRCFRELCFFAIGLGRCGLGWWEELRLIGVLAQPGSGGKRWKGLASYVRGTVKGPPESLEPETVGERDCEDKVEEAKPKTKAKLKTKKQRGSSGSPASVTWWGV